jgi:hypothetical protein
MGMERKTSPEDALGWYLHFNARFSNNIYDHEDDEDQRETIRHAEELLEEWGEMSHLLPKRDRAECTFHLFFDCLGMRDGLNEGSSVYIHMTEPCSELLIESAQKLNQQDKGRLACKVAQMSKGRFDSNLFRRMFIELVGPTDVGDVLDIIRSDLRGQYRDSDDIIIEIIDDDYRKFAERLLEAARRSNRGKLKSKLTIMDR